MACVSQLGVDCSNWGPGQLLLAQLSTVQSRWNSAADFVKYLGGELLQLSATNLLGLERNC